MPVTPSQLKRPHVVRHTVDIRDEMPVEFVYDANKLRESWIQEWTAIEASDDTGKLNEMLNDLILGWDIVNEDGSPYPKTVATLGDLFTIPDKALILRELMTAMNPTEDEKKGSSEPSSTQSSDSSAPAEISPNGSETFASQTVSASPSVT